MKLAKLGFVFVFLSTISMGSNLTADNQSMSQSDTDITAQIRKEVLKDDRLSTDAHNVKIITQGGKVTLKGPVKSVAEKVAVEGAAAKVVARAHITNEIEVRN